MVHWLWLIAAFLGGGCIAFFAAVFFFAAAVSAKYDGEFYED